MGTEGLVGGKRGFKVEGHLDGAPHFANNTIFLKNMIF